jgi:hypothetical protein
MEKISRSVHQAKQAKFLDADCTCPYSPYGDVAGPYRPYGDDGQLFIAWLLANRVVTRVRLVASNMRTRGPIHGRHVSPSLLVYLVV